MQKFQLLEASQLSSLIKDIVAQRVTLEAGIQTAAVQCIAQSVIHRNSTPANELFSGIKGGMRRDALVRMFEKYGNLCHLPKRADQPERITFFDATINEKHELVRKEILPPGKLQWNERVAAYVAAQHWTTQTAEKTIVSVYDAAKMTDDFFKKVRKHQHDVGVTVKHEDLVERLYSTYAAWVSEDAMNRAKLMTEDQQKKAVVEATTVAQTGLSPEKLEELATHFIKA